MHFERLIAGKALTCDCIFPSGQGGSRIASFHPGQEFSLHPVSYG